MKVIWVGRIGFLVSPPFLVSYLNGEHKGGVEK